MSAPCTVTTELVLWEGSPAEVFVLEDPSSKARAELIPARGALLSRWTLDGEPVLYLDESTLWDKSKSVRGGIPVLFPIAGKIPGDTFSHEGKSYWLKQHGFARNQAWTVVSSSGGDAAEVVLGLVASDLTRAVFPFDFEATLTFRLSGRRLDVDFAVKNTGTERMPLHYGLHPYFQVSDAEKAQCRLEAEATRAHVNQTGDRIAYGTPDFTLPELDLHLLDSTTRHPVFHRGSLPALVFDWSADFPVVVLWTVKGKDYVCVEPWTAPGGALVTGEGLRFVDPGQRVEIPFATHVRPGKSAQ